MRSSPYPVPRDPVWLGILLVGWGAGVGAGAWALVRPPTSYDGVTVWLTTLWGALLLAGSAGALAGHVLRRHRMELAGLWPALGGAVLYAALSWQATLTDSPGTGTRACLMVLLSCLIAARIRWLRLVEKRVQAVDRIGGCD